MIGDILQDVPAFQEISAFHVVLAQWLGYFPILSIMSLSSSPILFLVRDMCPTVGDEFWCSQVVGLLCPTKLLGFKKGYLTLGRIK